MSIKEMENNTVIGYNEENKHTDNTIELVRRAAEIDNLDNSWDHSNYEASHVHSKDIANKTPPFVSTMITDTSNLGEVSYELKKSSSTQTEASTPYLTLNSIADVSISFSKDFNLLDSTSNENFENSVTRRSKRDTSDELRDLSPSKKTKCSDSRSSTTSDFEGKYLSDDSVSCGHLSSTSEASFKSVKSDRSAYKIPKRRVKSNSGNLFREVVQRTRKTFSDHALIENSTGTPRKERSRRSNRTKAWKILDICTWIGRKVQGGVEILSDLYSIVSKLNKGYQSLTGFYLYDILREPLPSNEAHQCTAQHEVLELRKYVEEVDKKQTQLVKDNEFLNDAVKKLMKKIEELEGKLGNHVCQGQVSAPPPPPPPPPIAPTRMHTVPRCGSAPSRIPVPRLTITPQDITNVKLRKTKDNPAKKPIPKEVPPLVTQQMLQSTRARLRRVRPVAASTPKQQLTDLEKCLLQETSVTSLYRRRVARTTTFRRVRPYSSSRAPRSPRSPRASSVPRRPSPLKQPKCALRP